MENRCLKIILLVIFAGVWHIAAASAHADNTRLMAQLDSVVANRDTYIAMREAKIKEVRQRIAEASSDSETDDLLSDLFNLYHSFNTDSAYAVSQQRIDNLRRTGNREMLAGALLNKANILTAVGMYAEATALLDSIDSASLPDYMRSYYFHTARTVYGNLADYAAFEPQKEYYGTITDAYRDSLLQVYDPGSMYYALIKADQLNVHGKPREAVSILESYMADNELPEHDRAICAWTLSESYGMLGDTDNQKRQIIISAISDMKSAVREYVSLRQLALLLYKEGDLDRAYKFLTIAVDDAAKCNARQRIIELNDSYPAINSIYVETVRNQKKDLERTIIIITVMAAILIFLLVFLLKQMQRLRESQRKVEEANTNLTRSNANLQQAYRDIAEISELKEVYISKYMEQSLSHIELLDGFRKNITKLVNAGKTNELMKLLKSDDIVDNELKLFYRRFDETFLRLFPNFVDEFNSLLQPEEAIIPKKSGALNTELRIYALIRLGITDSAQIAQFLHYSLTTIYNYRTKVRNKARGDRNRLEAEIAKIGRR